MAGDGWRCGKAVVRRYIGIGVVAMGCGWLVWRWFGGGNKNLVPDARWSTGPWRRMTRFFSWFPWRGQGTGIAYTLLCVGVRYRTETECSAALYRMSSCRRKSLVFGAGAEWDARLRDQ